MVIYHEGVMEDEIQTFYNVSRSEEQMDEAWILLLDARYPPIGNKPPRARDYGFAHDACCGLGGFSTACEFLGIQVLSAVDFAFLATEAYSLFHASPVWCADVGSLDSMYRMHALQKHAECQPVLMAGFPCQPLSRQGNQLGPQDLRSLTLPTLLKVGHQLQSAGVLFECAPEAHTDENTQSQLRAFAEAMDFELHQIVLNLHKIWPSRRTRRFAFLFPKGSGFPGFRDLPSLTKLPVVGDMISPFQWPVWNHAEEEQLAWTELEAQVYKDPASGSPDGQVDFGAPFPRFRILSPTAKICS